MNVYQSEREAVKARILQRAILYTIFCGTLLNLGMTLRSQGNHVGAITSLVGAGI